MFNRKSSYALNKKDFNAIVYIDANENIIRLTREDFSSEEEFQKQKAWSDENYHTEDNRDVVEGKHNMSIDDLWFVIQFLCHEWYSIFSKGVMGSLEDKIKYFSGAIKWIEIDGRYIPDVYHTILHILILAVVITTALYIRNSKKRV